MHGKLSKAMARRDRVRYEHQRFEFPSSRGEYSLTLLLRLASVHAAEAEKLAKLTDLVLRHHDKDKSNATLQVIYN